MSTEPTEPYYPGLDGVIAGETSVSTIEGGLSYYGYPIEELAGSTSFVETAYLLLHGELPTEEELADFKAILVESAEVPPELFDFMKAIPLHVGGMDVLRTGISALAHFDPQLDDDTPAGNIAKATRLLAQIPMLIAARHRFQQGLSLVEPDPEASFAGNVLRMIKGRDPTPSEERAMDVSLVLYAEHEFNASTFTARVVTSTMSDLHSSIVAAVGALKARCMAGRMRRCWRFWTKSAPRKTPRAGCAMPCRRSERSWASVIASIRRAILGRDCSAVIARPWRPSAAISRWSRWPTRWRRSSGRRRSFPPISIGPALGSIATWDWKSTCSRRCSSRAESPAGRPTLSNKPRIIA